MIRITDKANCCGCNVCGDICPKQAISFKNDNEGFWYPEVDMLKCIECGLCEKICPCLNEKDQHKPLEVYAAINPDEEIRMNSSSGGIFWVLVNQTINEGGLVFGAAFDKEWQVCHTSAATLEDAKILKGSKYVQSRVAGCYMQVRDALDKGRKVLFSGTACQIAALKSFLRKDFENLLTIDVVCHGVPSPVIWKDYIKSLANSKTISNINFRDKRSGWRNYDISVQFMDGTELRESHYKNLYMQGFLHDLFLRPSCHSCKFKAGRCGSDITLGDFWGIEKVLPDLDDNRGTSVVIVNTTRGESSLQMMSQMFQIVEYEQVVKVNPCIITVTPQKEIRGEFMRMYQSGEGLSSISSVLKRMQPSQLELWLRRIKRVLSHNK
jgi:coenzyme F420-reducing hydrogenase beta subunit